MEPDRIEFRDLARVVGETWRALQPFEKAPYEAVAQREAARYAEDKAVADDLQRAYVALHQAAQKAGGRLPLPDPVCLHAHQAKSMMAAVKSRADVWHQLRGKHWSRNVVWRCRFPGHACGQRRCGGVWLGGQAPRRGWAGGGAAQRQEVGVRGQGP